MADDADPQPTPEEVHLAAGIDYATGFATDGDLPINHRLRAEALVNRGETTDAGGLISDELIADTADRLAREKAEADRAETEERKAKPSMRWTEEKLREEAARRGAVVEGDANKAAILAAIEAAPPAPNTEA